ncbi:fungal hydrophobin [Fomes fomentarius]|nr:fungal hydrophobin [Fomes fomentarius]
MFSKLAIYTTAVFSVLAVATPLPTDGGAPPSCSTGPVQCCNSIVHHNDSSYNFIFGLLGLVLDDVDAYVGFNCNPIEVISVLSGNACASNAVCCQNNAFGGGIGIGCIPVTL